MSSHPLALNEAAKRCSGHLERIAEIWAPEMKITLLVRHPTVTDGSRDFILTSDDLNQASAALLRLEKAKAEERVL